MGIFFGSVRAGVAGALCFLMVGQAGFAAGPVVAKAKANDSERVLHALNRFTFGPRPGDVAAVQAMGLDAWFEQQLNPGGIDDSALEGRLDAFPAMRMGQAELMQRYPDPAVIREMVKRNEPLPNDPVERAIYADQIEFYKMRVAAKAGDGAGFAGKKAVAKQAMAGDDGVMASGAMSEATDAKKDAAEQAKAEDAGGDPLKVTPMEHVEGLYPEAESRRVIGLAPEARVAAVLGMKAAEMVAFRRSLSRRELGELVAGLTPLQRETLTALAGSERVIGVEAQQSRLIRDIYSDRQLEAVMTDFWVNHFNVYLKKSQLEPSLIASYERDVIRPLALGKFEDLLVATARSPAMLVYLDNWQSTGPDSLAAKRVAGRRALLDVGQPKKPLGLNENYARELMELHTLGVGGGYTQADVTQVAKVFTGWTIFEPYREATFEFAENRHEPGAKLVLGQKIPESGETEGLKVLHLLATSPATARFISTKLAVRFVGDEPPAALVERMAKAFLASGGDMKVVLRTMFQSPEFWAPGTYRAKVKTPLEFVVSAVRASDAQVTNAQPLVQALDRLGMPLYGMQTPNGYSWKQEPWVSTGALVNRMNFALLLSADKVGGVRTAWPRVLGEDGGVRRVSAEGGGTEGAKERKLEVALLGEPVSERTRATVLGQFGDETMRVNAEKEFGLGGGGEVPRGRGMGAGFDAQAAGMAGLLLGSPEFQRR